VLNAVHAGSELCWKSDHGDALRFEKPLDAVPPTAAEQAKGGLHPRANRL